jgi:cephalosporin hydroxylase
MGRHLKLPKDHADSPEGRAAAGLDSIPHAPARAIAPRSRRERRAIDRFHRLWYDQRRAFKAGHFLGTRVYKCPLDLWVYQELVWELRPDLVVETGTLHGGSALFFGCMLDLVDNGEVVSIDIAQLQGRPDHPRVTYLHGSSTADDILGEVRDRASRLETVMVVLDSSHRQKHVLRELRAYGPLVTPGSYLIVEDTNVNGHPADPSYGPGPWEAVEAFLAETDDFRVDRSREKFLMTLNPDGYLRKRASRG